jgi:uncharacterized protein (TIGR02186 family)
MTGTVRLLSWARLLLAGSHQKSRAAQPFAALLVAVLLLAPAAAKAENLVTSLSSHRVAITSNYTGAPIAIFGAIERDAQTVSRAAEYDIVIIVRGPRQYLVVREKERMGPVWINSDQQKFPEAPSYLGVFTSRPLEEIASPTIQARHRVGMQAIINAPDFTNERGPLDEPFREALLRLKSEEGLYVEEERGVAFLTPTMFRASVPVPATAPPGNYDVEVILFADSAVLAKTQTNFELVKTGFEQRVGEIAHDDPLIYGISTALVALLFGYIANVVFRRD